MKTQIKQLSRFIASIIIFSTMMIPKAGAVISLEAIPSDGSNSIRFGNIDSPAVVNAEVRLRITSNENKQYQLFQRLQEPLVNDRGEQLSRNAIYTSAIIGSNSSGTLYVNDAEQLSFSDQLIYTSNPGGLSDSFTLIYHVEKDEVSQSGSFFGKVIYILRPVDGGTQKEVVLNTFLESFDEEFLLEVESSTLGDQIILRSDSEYDAEKSIKFKYKGNFGGSVKIYQELERFPTNEDGRLLDKETLEFYVRGAEHGQTDYIQPENLNNRRVLLYEGSAREDIVEITYALDQRSLADQFAGAYTGRINLIVEAPNSQQIYPYTLDVGIEPVFELSAEYPDGGVSFKELLPDSPSRTKEVIVAVKTNIGKPYEVVQNVSNRMMNEEGEMIEPEYFTMRTSLITGEKGRVQVDEFKPVNEGNTTIFMSDKNGVPAKFKVDYRLKPYVQMPAGQYKTSVVFSLNEI